MAAILPKRALSVALGTEKVRGLECIAYIQRGLAAGYRTIDTAQAYQNEAEIGEAIRRSSIPRDQVSVTSKISSGFKKNPSDLKEAEDSARATIDKLGIGSVDLFLIHSPGEEGDPNASDARKFTWQALEGLVAEGSVKSIGVSNYTAKNILEMQSYAKIYPPRVNQLELHPWCQQRDLVGFCVQQEIDIQAYSALARNRYSAREEIGKLAQKHNKSAAQLLIRYSLQKGWTPIVKATSLAHLRTNAQIDDFYISGDDLELMDSWDMKMDGSILPWLINPA